MESVNVLIAEDEPAIAGKILELINDLNWTGVITPDIPGMFDALASQTPFQQQVTPFQIIVLDRMLKGLDSADYINSIRFQHPTIKIFILSAISSSLEKAKLIDSGADDYLAKPFESTEFQARLKALTRNSILVNAQLSYDISNISLDLISRQVSVEGQVLNLTVKEYLVLFTLTEIIGKISSKNRLIETIWGYSLENETNVVESTVNSLRRKLEQAGARVQIKNTRFVGYWIEI